MKKSLKLAVVVAFGLAASGMAVMPGYANIPDPELQIVVVDADVNPDWDSEYKINKTEGTYQIEVTGCTSPKPSDGSASEKKIALKLAQRRDVNTNQAVIFEKEQVLEDSVTEFTFDSVPIITGVYEVEAYCGYGDPYWVPNGLSFVDDLEAYANVYIPNGPLNIEIPAGTKWDSDIEDAVVFSTRYKDVNEKDFGVFGNWRFIDGSARWKVELTVFDPDGEKTDLGSFEVDELGNLNESVTLPYTEGETREYTVKAVQGVNLPPTLRTTDAAEDEESNYDYVFTLTGTYKAPQPQDDPKPDDAKPDDAKPADPKPAEKPKGGKGMPTTGVGLGMVPILMVAAGGFAVARRNR